MVEVPSSPFSVMGASWLSFDALPAACHVFAYMYGIEFNTGPGPHSGKAGAKLKTDDSMEEVLHVMSHDSILFFTEDGVARSLKAYQIPEASRTAVGAAITQVLTLSLRSEY